MNQNVLKNGDKKSKIGKIGIYKKGGNWYIDYYVGGKRKREKVGKDRARRRRNRPAGILIVC